MNDFVRDIKMGKIGNIFEYGMEVSKESKVAYFFEKMQKIKT